MNELEQDALSWVELEASMSSHNEDQIQITDPPTKPLPPLPVTPLPFAMTPIDVIQLSSDTGSAVQSQGNESQNQEVDGGGGNANESIADRVAARRRVHFVGLADLV